MPDIRQLRYFIALAEDLHFGRAAGRLHIAQPALTRQIQNLERDLGVSLFHRTQRAVEITAAGRSYLTRARQVLEDLDKAKRAAQQADSGEAGRLVMGFLHSSTYNLLPAVIRRFRERYPLVDLELREMTIAEQRTALRAGVIDVGLLRPPVPDPMIEWRSIHQERFLAVVPDGHPLAEHAYVSLRDLKDDPFILFPRDRSPLFHTRILAMCEKAGFVPTLAQYAIQIHTVVGLVGAGMGVALVPEVGRYLSLPGVRFIHIRENPAPVEVAVAWIRGNTLPTIHTFRAVAVEAADSLARQPQPQGTPAPGPRHNSE